MTAAAGMATMAMTCGVTSAQDLSARDYHIDTTLVAEGEPQVVIVSSDVRPAYAAIARRVQDRIRELSGVEAPIIEAAGTSTDEVLGDRSAIVLGNLATSTFVEELYWQWYCILDTWYPGPGGYVLRTLHDPYGTGRNVIFLGGSDDEGVSRAADALCQVLDEGEPLTVGRLMQIELGENHAVPPEGEGMDPRLRIFYEPLEHRTVHECPLGFTDATLAGLRYYYNGDEEALARFRDLALNTDLLSSTYHYYAHMHAIIWDLIEESSFFSDEDRRAITEKLLEYARGPEGTAGRETLTNDAALHNASEKLLDRHSAMRANCILTHSRYFNKHWPAAEWEENLEAVRAYFDRSMTSAKGWRDEGNMHTYLECPLMAALLLRDRRMVESGALRHYAELVLMFCNNNGYMTTFGGGYPGTVLRASAALLDDPGFLATLPRHAEAERAEGRYRVPYGFMNGQAWDVGLQPQPMERMVGVYHRPLTRWQWEYYGRGFDFEKGMDKLTMRSGFGRDDQYLLLDGISVGGGKPNPNRNAILSLGENGQTLLLGGARSMVVSREGLGEAEGQIVSLETTADLATFGYSHTRAADHPFAAWDRHIFWRKGEWFAVLDQVTAREAGRHSVVCNWRPLGSLEVTGHTASAARGEGQDRAVIHITPAEPVRIDTTGNVVRQTQFRGMSAGEQAVTTNLIYVEGERAPNRYSIAKVSPHAAVLSGREQAYFGLAPDGAFERGGVAIRGAAFCLSPDSLALVQGTSLRCSAIAISASAPCNMELQPQPGRVTVETTEDLTVTIGGEAHHCEPGIHSFDATLEGDDPFTELLAAIRQDAASPRPEPPAAVPADLPELPVAWSRRVGDPGSYLCYHVGDVDASGRDEILVGMKDGRAVCLDDSGETLWEYATDGPVRALAHATLAGQPAVLVGSEDEHVHAITADGQTVLWTHKCHVSEERYQAAPWWMMGFRAPVLEILPTDLDGDGAVEVICGTGGGFVEALSADGERLWMREFFWGLPNHIITAPAPDGSTHLLVNATTSACGSHTWRLDAAGEIISKNALDTGRGSWDSTLVQACEVVQMDEAGTPMAIVGRGGAFDELALHDAVTGERRWRHPLADRATTVAAVDLDGDGTREVLAGSVSAWLCAFDLAGDLQWATLLPNEVLAVTTASDGLLAQCADGNIYRLSLAGEFTGVHAPESPAAPSYRNHWRFQRLDGSVLIGDNSGMLAPLQVAGQ